MRYLGWVIACSLGLAVLQAGAKLILAGGLVLFGWLALTQPLQTVAALALLTGYGLLMKYPLQSLAIVSLIAAAQAYLKARRQL